MQPTSFEHSRRLITDARAAAEQAQARLQQLVGAGALLSRSLEEETTLAAMKVGAVMIPATTLLAEADLRDRIERARVMTTDNPIARALVDRADAIARNDRDELLRTASTLAVHGCRYQWARTLVLAGGAERLKGEEALARMGTTPMALPRVHA